VHGSILYAVGSCFERSKLQGGANGGGARVAMPPICGMPLLPPPNFGFHRKIENRD